MLLLYPFLMVSGGIFRGGPDSTTLPLYIYAMVKRGISPQINALSTCMMLVTVSLVVVSQLLQMKSLHDTRKE